MHRYETETYMNRQNDYITSSTEVINIKDSEIGIDVLTSIKTLDKRDQTKEEQMQSRRRHCPLSA